MTNRAKYQRDWYLRNKDRKKELVAEAKERKRVFIDSLKTPCSQCGEADKRCLDFHHVDPSTKEFDICAGWKHGKSNARIVAEIAKCVILCANCHRKTHNGNLDQRP